MIRHENEVVEDIHYYLLETDNPEDYGWFDYVGREHDISFSEALIKYAESVEKVNQSLGNKLFVQASDIVTEVHMFLTEHANPTDYNWFMFAGDEYNVSFSDALKEYAEYINSALN